MAELKLLTDQGDEEDIDSERATSTRETIIDDITDLSIEYNEIEVEKDGTKTINDDAHKINKALNTLGFCTLYFNSLSSQSINTLLEVLHHIDHSQLATFALVFLCKGKTRHLYDCNNELIDADEIFGCLQDDQSPFAQLPKIYYFHFAHDKEPKEKLQISSVPSKNLILLITSVIQENSSVVLDTVTNNLKEGASIQKCFEEIEKECNRRDDMKVFCMYINKFNDKFVLPTPYIPFNLRAEKEYYKKQLELYRSMWHPIRSETISVISENKDSILSIVYNERIARIAASSASLVIGGGMMVLGLALIPVTLGASVGLSVAGGAIGASATLGGVGAFITRTILEIKQLKSAQEHISLDQQLSISINEIAMKYSAAMVKCTESALSSGEMVGVVAGGAQSLANLGRAGMSIAVAGVESAAEVGAIALRTGARVAGVALAGISLAVTVPIDIGFIGYHSYNIHKSSKDKTGKTDSNQVVQWFIKQIEDMLK
uniref:Caspase family p20 domain-containing protein n=1 Tax=Amphimedon queenslandica TaxID=400682 RepID=A0A1X7U7Q6_AMPQE